ncbi:MAG: hypothetical protein QG657_858 [Acidobacteriota bacterium]|nr:hypothetical protein [Acidobacteriota bacterium]
MKKLLVIMLFVSLLATFLPANSQIKFKETTINFGEIDSGAEVNVKFEFENAGDSILVIKNISTTCGCTTTQLEKLEYQPGEKGAIPVKFNSKGYSGKTAKTITVSSNDEANPYSRLEIAGNVNLKDFSEMEITPDTLDFGKVTMGKTYSKKVTITNPGTLDLEVIEITHSTDVDLGFLDKKIRPHGEVSLEIAIKPMDVGTFTSFLKFRTNAYKQRLMIVRISAEVTQ